MLKLERQALKKLSGRGVHAALDLRSSLSEIFHENTKLTPLSGRAYGQTIASVLKDQTARTLMAHPYKVYSLMDTEALPAPVPVSELERTIAERRSRRSFTGQAITREELSRLLFFSYGRTDVGGPFRAVASGGALYPLELYVIARNVKGLEPGVYHYGIENHGLDAVRRGEDRWALMKKCVGLQDIEDPDAVSLLIVVTAIFQRSTMKYQDRGYRMILMEAGEVAQNMNLLATSLGLGLCPLGSFVDDQLAALLEVDGVDEAPLLPLVLGRIPTNGSGKPFRGGA